MFIEQILFPVESLGPGKRITIWTVGCKRKCQGCSNPELWSKEGKNNISVNQIIESVLLICKDCCIDGFTITGGEPFEQIDELGELVKGLFPICNDILIYSGYKYEELLNFANIESVFDYIGVLIDGEYVQEKNLCLPLRGSSNQNIILFQKDLENKYNEYLIKGNCIQNFYFNEQVISVGIHKKDFTIELNNILLKYGLRMKSNEKNEVAKRTGDVL